MPAPKKALFGAPSYPKICLYALLGSRSPPFTRPRSAAKGEGPGTRAIPALLRVPGPATTTKKLPVLHWGQPGTRTHSAAPV